MEKKNRFQDLPQSIFDRILDYLQPIHQALIPRALDEKGLAISLAPEHQTSLLWDLVFKNTVWLDRIFELKETYPYLRPTLLGAGLKQLPSRKPIKQATLALLLNDIQGYTVDDDLHKKLFGSLRSHHYDKMKKVVTFTDSGIKLHISGALGYNDCFEVDDPRALFRQRRKNLYTCALYYGDPKVYKLGLDAIGGVEGRSIKRRYFVKDICSVRLECGDGSIAFAHFMRRGMEVRLSPARREFEHNQEVVVSWREPLRVETWEGRSTDSDDSD